MKSRIAELPIRDLDLDSNDEAKAHLDLAVKFLNEAKQAIERGYVVQASEKMYKVAEECIKAMAEALNLEEAQEVKAKGRWTLRLLDIASQRLGEIIDRRIYDDWSHAYFLHVEGFHEARLGIDQVKARARYVEELLEIAKEVVKHH